MQGYKCAYILVANRAYAIAKSAGGALAPRTIGTRAVRIEQTNTRSRAAGFYLKIDLIHHDAELSSWRWFGLTGRPLISQLFPRSVCLFACLGG